MYETVRNETANASSWASDLFIEIRRNFDNMIETVIETMVETLVVHELDALPEDAGNRWV